jgi:sugar lactone lactonase YvrE
MKVDGRGRLLVAGGQTGQAYVHDGSTGADLAVYTLAQGSTFINDVTATSTAAWFTDSHSPVLCRVPIHPDGSLGDQADVSSLALTGDFQFDAGKTNANGIAATPDGATLLIVQTSTGKLFSVNGPTGRPKRSSWVPRTSPTETESSCRAGRFTWCRTEATNWPC